MTEIGESFNEDDRRIFSPRISRVKTSRFDYESVWRRSLSRNNPRELK